MARIRDPDRREGASGRDFGGGSTRVERIPLIILGGSDGKAADLPEAGSDKHPLAAYKGVAIRIGDRPLLEVVLDGIEDSGKFGPVFLAGPSRVYGEIRSSVVRIETDGRFGENIRAAVEHVREACPGRPQAFLTCDVTLSSESLRRLVERYRADSPVDLWFPSVRAPTRRDRLGASSWKPAYRLAPGPGKPPVGVLPGHLVIADVDAIRLGFAYRLLGVGYGTRNRSINARRGALVVGMLGTLLWHDLLHVLSFRVPNLTWSVMRAGLSAASRLRDGRLSVGDLEEAVQALFVKYRHRRRHPDRGVRMPIVDDLDLAMDIDTVEEARERGARVGNSGGGSSA